MPEKNPECPGPEKYAKLRRIVGLFLPKVDPVVETTRHADQVTNDIIEVRIRQSGRTSEHNLTGTPGALYVPSAEFVDPWGFTKEEIDAWVEQGGVLEVPPVVVTIVTNDSE